MYMDVLQDSNLPPSEEAKLLLISEDMTIKYDGSYPNLCSGTLEVTIGFKTWAMNRVLCSGGGLDSEYNAYSGPWSINELNLPKNFPRNMIEKLTELVNEEVPWGCCGGCA